VNPFENLCTVLLLNTVLKYSRT